MHSVGIIDIGSNTVRLSVVELLDGAYRVRHEDKAALRLAARVRPDGTLGPEAADETARVLLGFRAACADWGVGQWLAVATAAVRHAADGLEFVRVVAERTGIPLRIASGAEEAHLGFVGACNTLAERDGVLVDVGGASTEITFMVDRRAQQAVSVPFGAVNTAARFGLHDRAAKGALHSLQEALDAAFAAAGGVWAPAQPALIGVGGTVRALAKMDRRRRGYPLDATHNYLLDPAEVVDLQDRLADMDAKDRARLPGLTADRADLIAAGTAILAWAIGHAAPERVVVSGSGLREGLFYRHILRDRAEPIYEDVLAASALNLQRLHGLPAALCERSADLAGALWECLGPLASAPAECARLVPVAARLRAAGTAVSYYDWERHTFYILREARLFGLDHRQRLLLAAAAGYEGAGRLRDALAPYAAILRPGDDRLATRMGVCVAVAHAIDQTTGGRAHPIRTTALPSAIRVTVSGCAEGGVAVPAAVADEVRKWYGRALGVIVEG